MPIDSWQALNAGTVVVIKNKAALRVGAALVVAAGSLRLLRYYLINYSNLFPACNWPCKNTPGYPDTEVDLLINLLIKTE